MMTRSLSDVIVFDLDDTLYKEVSFVESGFRAIANHLGYPSFADELMSSWKNGRNAFEQLISDHSLTIPIDELLAIYRTHVPAIELETTTIATLDALAANGKILGIITDGRSLTQRNKINALGLSRWFADDDIIISEEFGSSKPDVRNYRFFMEKYAGKTYTYIGDNVTKDFIAPNSLGWLSICLKDNGHNIHSQNFGLSKEYLPDITINNFVEISTYSPAIKYRKIAL